MARLSRRLENMSESATIAMSQRSRELKAQGLDIISLSLGEPDFNTPDMVKEAAKQAIDDNFTTYPPVPGYKSLQEAICDKFKRENGLDYKPSQIVVSTGAKQSLANIFMALVDDGDEVILPAPYWVTYYEQAVLAGGKPVELQTSVENDFKITPDQLRAAITDNSRLIVFSSPCNPSGSVYTKEELKALADVIAEKEELYVVADEIYEYITFEGQAESIGQFDNIKDRVITVNGVAKGFAMTGWRIGYIGAPEWIAKACSKFQGQITSGACSIAQKATEAAVKEGKNIAKDMLEAFRRRRDLVIEKMREIPGVVTNVPKGAFYLFPDVSSYFGSKAGDTVVNNASDLAMYLLNEAHVATVTGDAFGSPNCIRLSYATSDELLVEAVRRIKEALAKLEKVEAPVA